VIKQKKQPEKLPKDLVKLPKDLVKLPKDLVKRTESWRNTSFRRN
jgi:hypothetical protein